MVAVVVTVVEAVEAELEVLAPVLAESSLAAAMVALAREIDAVGNSATSKAQCSRALLELWQQLRELASLSAGDAPTLVDELRRRTA